MNYFYNIKYMINKILETNLFQNFISILTWKIDRLINNNNNNNNSNKKLVI